MSSSPVLRLGSDEGNASSDGRYVPVHGTRVSDGRLVVFVIDLVNAAKSPDVDVLAQGFASAGDLDWESVDASGRYLILHGKINGTSQLSKVYDRATSGLLSFWSDSPLGHWDTGKDAAGNDVAFGRPSSGTYNNRFVTRRFDTGAITPLTPGYGYFAYHASMRALARPGWGEATIDPGQAPPFTGEVMWVKLDGSGAVERLAHHRSTGSTFWAQPQGVPSPDGRRVLFASDWGVAGGSIQAYVVSCP